MTQQISWLLGIDGGGTGCRARLVAADGAVLGEGESGPSNLTIGLERAIAAVLEAALAALHAAGLDETAFAGTDVGLGIAGANLRGCEHAFTANRLPFRSLTVRSDAEIACLGAHGGQDGAILILGTGSAGAVMREGRTTTLGGWGFLLSDCGSGAVLGHALARRALLAHEGLAQGSPLTRRVMAQFHDDPASMLDWALAAIPRDWASLAPLVFEHADQGDPVADHLLSEMVSAVEAMLDRLIALGGRPIALMGGMASACRPRLGARYEGCLVDPKGDALDGAIALARRARSIRS